MAVRLHGQEIIDVIPTILVRQAFPVHDAQLHWLQMPLHENERDRHKEGKNC